MSGLGLPPIGSGPIFRPEDFEGVLYEAFMTACFPILLIGFLFDFFQRFVNLPRRFMENVRDSDTDGAPAPHESSVKLVVDENFASRHEQVNSPLMVRMRTNLSFAVKWLRSSTIVLFFLLPVLALVALPSASEICNQSYGYSKYSETPDWALACEEAADYRYTWEDRATSSSGLDGEYRPYGPFFETSAMMYNVLIVWPFVFYFILMARYRENRRLSDSTVSFVYWGAIFNSIMILVTVFSLIYNVSNLPEAGDFSEGELLSQWNDAHRFHAVLPAASWAFVCVPIAALCGWLEDRSNLKEKRMRPKWWR